MSERRFSVQIELKLYDFALPEGYVFFPVPICSIERTKQEDSHPERNVRRMRRRTTGSWVDYISATYSVSNFV